MWVLYGESSTPQAIALFSFLSCFTPAGLADSGQRGGSYSWEITPIHWPSTKPSLLSSEEPSSHIRNNYGRWTSPVSNLRCSFFKNLVVLIQTQSTERHTRVDGYMWPWELKLFFTVPVPSYTFCLYCLREANRLLKLNSFSGFLFCHAQPPALALPNKDEYRSQEHFSFKPLCFSRCLHSCACLLQKVQGITLTIRDWPQWGWGRGQQLARNMTFSYTGMMFNPALNDIFINWLSHPIGAEIGCSCDIPGWLVPTDL